MYRAINSALVIECRTAPSAGHLSCHVAAPLFRVAQWPRGGPWSAATGPDFLQPAGRRRSDLSWYSPRFSRFLYPACNTAVPLGRHNPGFCSSCTHVLRISAHVISRAHILSGKKPRKRYGRSLQNLSLPLSQTVLLAGSQTAPREYCTASLAFVLMFSP